MNIFKKLFFVSLFVAVLSLAKTASAMTPTFSASPDVNDATQVEFNVQGDPNASIILYYYPTTGSGPDVASLGTTNSSGSFTSNILLSEYNIAQNSSAYVVVNGQSSPAIAWTYANPATTNLTLSQGSVVVSVGQSQTITGSNTTSVNPLYLASNSNSQIANVSINGNQISVTGLSVGQTTLNICVLNSSTGQNCASVYVVVQNSSSAALTFSQNNTSIISGQNSQINISGGNGFYEVENNSNPSIISASFNGPVMTLYANGTTGTSTITICSTDNSACGVVTASIGTYTTSGSGLVISQMYPTVMTGQTQTISISGGEGTYYLSSNSSTAVVQTSLSGNTITLYGNTPGTATIVVCAPSGECGTISATVVSTSGGALTLSQESIGMIPGQVTSVTISGGTQPYSLLEGNNNGIAQYSLSGSVLTVTAVSAGSSSATICSAGGACITLSVTVSGTSATVSGVEPTFSQNDVSLNLTQTTAVSLSGNGGYYISNNSNPNSVSAAISGSTVVLSGITVGSANISVCQSGGQCNVIYVSVSNTSTPTISSVPLSFSPSSVSLNLGQSVNVSVTGGSGVGYYVSYNSSPSTIGVYVAGSNLNITGNANGDGTLSVCSSANICGSIGVVVNQSATGISSGNSVGDGFVFNNHMQYGMSDKDFTRNDVTELQKRLTALGVYSGPITGYYGSLTTAAVERYQNLKGLSPIGQVGPGTRAALNN